MRIQAAAICALIGSVILFSPLSGYAQTQSLNQQTPGQGQPINSDTSNNIHPCDVTGISNNDSTPCPVDPYLAITCPINAESCISGGATHPSVSSSSGQAQTPVDVWNYCRYVDNTTSGASPVFVPINTPLEWTSFIGAWNNNGNIKNYTNLALCSRPGQFSIPSDTQIELDGSANPWYTAALSCDQASYGNPPVLMPYARSGSVFPVPPAITQAQFICNVPGLCDVNDPTNCGANQQWTLTATATFSAGIAPDGDPSRPSLGNWTPTVVYSGNKPSPNPPANSCSFNGQFYPAPTCGPANGVAVSSAPASSLCGPSSPNATIELDWQGVRGSGPWSWQCDEVIGAAIVCTAPCSAPLVAGTDGQCGATQDACTAGTYAGDDSNDGTNYHWTCNGTIGGANASCSAPMAPVCIVTGTNLVGASCGPANGVPAAAAPSSGLCGPYFNGMSVLFNGPSSNGAGWSWQCASVVCIVDCTAPGAGINGQCGSANGVPDTVPSWINNGANICSAGGGTNGSTNGTSWTWDCAGSNGGTTAHCSAPAATDGVCGADNGAPDAVAPWVNNNGNLCASGNGNNGSNNGSSWTWTCDGINGGVTASCSAPMGGTCVYAGVSYPAPACGAAALTCDSGFPTPGFIDFNGHWLCDIWTDNVGAAPGCPVTCP